MTSPERPMPRGVREPHAPPPPYIPKFKEISTTQTLEIAEGVPLFKLPQEYTNLDEEATEALLESGRHYKYARDEYSEPARKQIRERNGMKEEDSTIIISGGGSADILLRTLDLLSYRGAQPTLYLLGVTFPFLSDYNETTKSKTNRKGRLQVIKTDLVLGSSVEREIEQAMLLREVRDREKKRPAIHYICHPTTPFGEVIPQESVLKYLKHVVRENDLAIIDQAYGMWMDKDQSMMPYVQDSNNLIVTESPVSKGFGLAGLRIGIAGMSKELGERFLASQAYNPFIVSGPQRFWANRLLSNSVISRHFDGYTDDNGNIIPGVREKAREIKQAYIEGIKRITTVTPYPTSLDTPIMSIMSHHHADFHTRLVSRGLMTSAGSGFASTHDEVDDSMVRLMIVNDTKLVPDVLSIIEDAAAA